MYDIIIYIHTLTYTYNVARRLGGPCCHRQVLGTTPKRCQGCLAWLGAAGERDFAPDSFLRRKDLNFAVGGGPVDLSEIGITGACAW